MMATLCTPCGGDLVLVRETFDEISRVYVGELACAMCGVRYMDQRQPTETRERGTMAKRASKIDRKLTKPDKPRRPRQADLPGTEDRAIKALEDKAHEYVNVRDERMALSKDESELKGALLALMKKHGKTEYKRDGITITIVPEAETVKVKVSAADEETDESETELEETASGNV